MGLHVQLVLQLIVVALILWIWEMTGQVTLLVGASDGEYNNLIDDATLRLRNCGSGTGEYIIISVAWQNSATDVCIDGSYLATISGARSGTWRIHLHYELLIQQVHVLVIFQKTVTYMSIFIFIFYLL